eukprot:164536-Amphidinium_carterae.1
MGWESVAMFRHMMHKPILLCLEHEMFICPDPHSTLCARLCERHHTSSTLGTWQESLHIQSTVADHSGASVAHALSNGVARNISTFVHVDRNGVSLV